MAKAQHLQRLLNKVSVEGLKQTASEIRKGVHCRIPALEHDDGSASREDIVSRQMGGQNCNVDVEFDDGVTWIARIRLEDPLLPPPEVQRHVFLSEIATLEFLARTSVPAPKVHHYQLQGSENIAGTSYVLMEKMPGKPLAWSGAGRARSNDAKVAGFAQSPWFKTPEEPLGPFSTLREAYTAILEQQLHTIGNREISSLPIDNSLAFMWQLSAIDTRGDSSTSKSGPFYLKHQDDKGDHILVDDDHNITGIIDWEFASAEAKEFWPSAPRDEICFADILASRGRNDLSEIVMHGRRWQRFLFFLGGIPHDKAEFKALFQGLRRTFAPLDSPEISNYKEWKEMALKTYSEDVRIQSLVQDKSRIKTAGKCS